MGNYPPPASSAGTSFPPLAGGAGPRPEPGSPGNELKCEPEAVTLGAERRGQPSVAARGAWCSTPSSWEVGALEGRATEVDQGCPSGREAVPKLGRNGGEFAALLGSVSHQRAGAPGASQRSPRGSASATTNVSSPPCHRQPPPHPLCCRKPGTARRGRNRWSSPQESSVPHSWGSGR